MEAAYRNKGIQSASQLSRVADVGYPFIHRIRYDDQSVPTNSSLQKLSYATGISVYQLKKWFYEADLACELRKEQMHDETL